MSSARNATKKTGRSRPGDRIPEECAWSWGRPRNRETEWARIGAGDARESGRVRGHEAAQWRRPGGLSPWRKKSRVPQSGGGGGKELGALGKGEASGSDAQALVRLFPSLLRPPSCQSERIRAGGPLFSGADPPRIINEGARRNGGTAPRRRSRPGREEDIK
ncbi:hypothetical protein NDU88_004181 [Pleurodeles waltl]|uniref:Uncharacterized protein n=1 Tax=Pleurodeles waltl TaxID=8319 RepID=A0AAV7M9B0_PLEWA|nr:hypothetical protein NDU88_004181 [Pleurodeles waltl]